MKVTELLPTPEQLAAEAREALRQMPPKTGTALFVELVRQGFINARGQVTKLIGGSVEPESNYETWTAEVHLSQKTRSLEASSAPISDRRCTASI
jgi:hypothetical protein